MAPAGAMVLAKSSSLPSLQRAGRGVFATSSTQGFPTSPVMSPKGRASLSRLPPAKSSSAQAMALMSSTFSPDGRGQVWSGRMEAMGYWGLGPPRAGARKLAVPSGAYRPQHIFEADAAPTTKFRLYFERGDLPIKMRHGAMPGVEWKVEPERLDYKFHLPVFFDGLLEKVEPFASMAYRGLEDMIKAAKDAKPPLLSPHLPVIIMPIRRALRTCDKEIMSRAINALQLLIRNDASVGEALVPYYRQLLPTFNLYHNATENIGDGIDYAQRKRENMGDLVHETLSLLEQTGGEDAFINIKYMIPTYESCA